MPLQGLALPAEIWERDVLPRRVGAYSPAWLDALCSSGELVWIGAGGRLGALAGRVALYFREDAPLIGPPSSAARGPLPDRSVAGASAPAHELLRARLLAGPCFFTDLLAELDLPAVAVREALFDLVWSGEVTNDSWAPLREPHLAGSSFARASSAAGAASGGEDDGSGVGARDDHRPRLAALRPAGRPAPGRARFGARRARVGAGGFVHPPGAGRSPSRSSERGEPSERRRVLAELLLERYGILTREQVLAERIEGGFAALYETLCDLETLGVCRRGYFVEGLGGAQFALPGAVERLRARRPDSPPPPAGQPGELQPVAPGERTPGDIRRARARRLRPRPAIRRRAALARARAPGGPSHAAVRRVSPAPTSCSSPARRFCMSSAAVVA